jgi:putative toxin-antitoxin system antitoxin component (TIGR02293 family)
MATHQDSISASNILKMLGASRHGQKGTSSTAYLRSAVRKGLPFSAFETVLREVDLPQKQLSTILGIPTRTIARRKEIRQLTAAESDRLYRVARVAVHAASVLGDMDKARAWLKRPNRGLGDEVPLSLLDTDIGARQVEDVLVRLEYGIHG